MSLTKLSLGGKKLNYFRPGRVWSVTSRLGTGKRPTLFNSAWCRAETRTQDLPWGRQQHCRLIKASQNSQLTNFVFLKGREDWLQKSPWLSSFWVPRNLSHHVVRQAFSGDTVSVKSREMRDEIGPNYCRGGLGGGGGGKGLIRQKKK